MTKLDKFTDVYPRPAKSLYVAHRDGWLGSVWVVNGVNEYFTDDNGDLFETEDKADLAAIERVTKMNERMKK